MCSAMYLGDTVTSCVTLRARLINLLSIPFACKSRLIFLLNFFIALIVANTSSEISRFEDFEIPFLDMLSILVLNYIFNPLVAFTIYFCFLHSIRHIISISYELDPGNFLAGIRTFIKKSLPLTLVTAVLYLLAMFFLSNSYGLNDVVIKVIFIGLASLTFPHILLEYLLEKNEKRN